MWMVIKRLRSLALTIAMIGAIAVVDRVTGLELRVYPLYFFPIAYAAFRLPLRAALVAPVLSTGAWMWVNTLGFAHLTSTIRLFNSFMQAVAFVSIGILLSELRRRLEHERYVSRRDRLTGLANGLGFYEDGARIVANAARSERPMSLAYLDLDNFKFVNDTRGHLEGDQLLAAVAHVFEHELRAGDVAARLGGDEFALLLPNCDEDGARQLLERVRRAVLVRMQQGDWPVTVSVGAVAYNPAPASLQQAVQAADELMYIAKRQGKDRVHVRRVSETPPAPLAPPARTGTDS